MYTSAHIYYRHFYRDPSKLKTLELPLFDLNRLVLHGDMNFCISVPGKNKIDWRHFFMKVLLSGERSLLEERMCYKMSLMAFI